MEINIYWWLAIAAGILWILSCIYRYYKDKEATQ